MGDPENLQSYRLEEVEKRMERLETKIDGYLANAVKAVLAAVAFVLWEPLHQLLIVAGLMK